MASIIKNSFSSAIVSVLVLSIAFVGLEPAVLAGAASQFTISQTILPEVAFVTTASNVVLGPSLGGLTGGTSNGGTQVIVRTNNITGYNMTLVASSSLGMIGNASSSNYIPAYVPASAGVPDWTFSVPANAAEFGYTVEASTTADLVQSFKDDGSANCNVGSADTLNSCWLNASTVAKQIINRSTVTPYSGATTTLKFRVQIQANPNPMLPNDTYVATTTLTVTTN